MSCERDGNERWDADEIKAALREAYQLNGVRSLDEEGVMGLNFEVVTFESRRAYGKPRQNPRTVILVRRRGNGHDFTEYIPGEFSPKVDDMASDVRDDLPSDIDPYGELVDWIEERVRRQ